MTEHEVQIGKKFGRLTVIEEAGRDKRYNLLWRCICECGNETIMRGSSLRNGNTRSCGCLQRERTSETHKIDMIGKKFNRLTVIEDAGRSEGSNILWRCICECGNEKVVIGTALRNGSIKSCGCLQRERVSETHLGKTTSMEVRVRISCAHQGINREDWDGFADRDWRDWCNVVYINEPFIGCERHHITETIVICIPSELHRHIPHCLKTGENMAEMNMLALQYINGGL